MFQFFGTRTGNFYSCVYFPWLPFKIIEELSICKLIVMVILFHKFAVIGIEEHRHLYSFLRCRNSLFQQLRNRHSWNNNFIQYDLTRLQLQLYNFSGNRIKSNFLHVIADMRDHKRILWHDIVNDKPEHTVLVGYRAYVFSLQGDRGKW